MYAGIHTSKHPGSPASSWRSCCLHSTSLKMGGGGGLAQGLGIRLFAFGGAYWPLATAHSDPLWVRTCLGCVNGAPRCLVLFAYSRVGSPGDGLLPVVPLTRCIQMHTLSPCWGGGGLRDHHLTRYCHSSRADILGFDGCSCCSVTIQLDHSGCLFCLPYAVGLEPGLLPQDHCGSVVIVASTLPALGYEFSQPTIAMLLHADRGRSRTAASKSW